MQNTIPFPKYLSEILIWLSCIWLTSILRKLFIKLFYLFRYYLISVMLLFFPHKNPLGKFMKNMIRDVIDFPKNGVVFKDIFPLLQNSFHFVIDELAQLIESPKKIDVIAGIESRGFIFAAALAYKLNKGFVPIRKKGKLPPPVLQQKIILEYGEAELEMCEGKGKMIIIDDVLATGGTLQGAWILAKKCGYFPFQVITLIDIKGLHEKNLGFPYSSVFDYE